MSSGSTGEQTHSGTGHSLSQPHDPPDHPPLSNASSRPQSEASEGPELGVWASPLAIDEDSSETFGFSSKQAKMRYERALHYCPHQFIGPIPVEEFLETFMDCGRVLREWSDRMPPSTDAFTKVPKMADKESQIYEPLIEALNSYVAPKSNLERFRCPGFRFLDTSNRPDRTHGDVGKLKPDICCYAEPHIEVVQSALSEDDKLLNRGATVMGYAALFIEVKKELAMDPFNDLPAHQDRSRWKFVMNLQGVGTVMQGIIKDCFGQNVTYAAEILARQHRQFLYSILVCGTTARFIRWDRAGALVSTAFDIHRSPEHLCHFLWCFALASDMRRGYDINVEMAHPHEHDFFEAVIRQHLASQLPAGSTPAQLDKALKVHFLQDHVTAIRFPLGNSKEVKRLLVSRPFVYPLAVFGRGTRTYWAVDTTAPRTSAHRVVLLKDTWREDPPSNTQTEQEVLQRLLEVGGIRGVPSVLFYGDVIQREEVATQYPDQRFYMAIQDLSSYQSTQTQDFLGAPWICGAVRNDHLFHVRVRKHTHHRLVLDTPGHTLVQFSGTHELLSASYDILETLHGASAKCRTVHRALSPRSIILYRQPTKPLSRREGYLIDWDQSWDEEKDMDHDSPFSPPWQFVCADLAVGAEPMQRYKMVHDMEALLSGTNNAAARVLDMFDMKSVDGGRPTSEAKRTNKASRGRYTSDLLWKEPPAMQRWMNTVFRTQWTYDNIKVAWGKIVIGLAKTPEEHDRAQSLPPLNGREEHAPRALTAEPNCPTMSSPGSGSKRVLDQLYGGVEPVGSSLLKKVRLDLTLESERMVERTHPDDPPAEAGEWTAFLPRRVKISTRRNVLEAGTNAKAGPSRLAGSQVDVASSVSTSSNVSLANPHDAPSPGTSLVGRVGPDGGRNTRPSESTLASFPSPILAAEVDFLSALSKPL